MTEITIAHSPDSDDAFMFYAIAKGKINSGSLKIRQVMKDIQTLNLEARNQTYDVTAISFAAYREISDNYLLMPCGASFGADYGPVLIARKMLSQEDLKSATIAIPGKQTSAYLTLRLYQPAVQVVEHPFDQIIAAVSSGEVDAGLLIHEGQLTYKKLGLEKVLDLGEWWNETTKLPLPLGGNAIRKDLGDELIRHITKFVRESIVYALKHRQEALTYASEFARDMPLALLDQYVEMYVNELSVDCGNVGRKALNLFFQRAYDLGIMETRLTPEFSS
jgi:1,4-dihydroxy-6-naphthoate synthase